MLASLRNLLWPKQRRRQPANAMGTLSRLPDEVLTAKVAGYFSEQEYLSLRALCASGRDVACRAIRRAEKLSCNFLPRLTLNWPDCPGPLEMRDRPQHVVGADQLRLSAHACKLRPSAAGSPQPRPNEREPSNGSRGKENSAEPLVPLVRSAYAHERRDMR